MRTIEAVLSQLPVQRHSRPVQLLGRLADIPISRGQCRDQPITLLEWRDLYA